MGRINMRKSSYNVIKGAIILTVAGFLVRVIGFLYRLPLTYLIGDDGNGIYGAGYQIYNFFFTISTTGIPIAISKMVSERVALNREYEAYRVFKISIYIMIFVGVSFALMLGFGAKFFAHILNYDRAYYTMVALAPTLDFSRLQEFYQVFFINVLRLLTFFIILIHIKCNLCNLYIIFSFQSLIPHHFFLFHLSI
jgi:stage V sporulation protein B